MNESRESKNAEQLEELLLLTEEIQEELEQKDQLIEELKTQLSESLTLNEKLNKENKAGNIQALKNDLKLADRALQIEKEKLRSANVMIGECQDKIRCLTQQRDYARTHQKIVEIPVEKPVLYEKCEACDRTDYQNAKAKYETQKERLAGQYKAKTVLLYPMILTTKEILKILIINLSSNLTYDILFSHLPSRKHYCHYCNHYIQHHNSIQNQIRNISSIM